MGSVLVGAVSHPLQQPATLNFPQVDCCVLSRAAGVKARQTSSTTEPRLIVSHIIKYADHLATVAYRNWNTVLYDADFNPSRFSGERPGVIEQHRRHANAEGSNVANVLRMLSPTHLLRSRGCI